MKYPKDQDLLDPLSDWRKAFHFPEDRNGYSCLYFTGNSLGLQPKITKSFIEEELNDWAKMGVEGWFKGKNTWVKYHESLDETMADIVGATPLEVVVMNTLTANLHLMMVSFYQPEGKRSKILIESDAFPSDRYAVESQLKFHGLNPKTHLIEWKPRAGDDLLHLEDLEQIMDRHGQEIALILVGGVNYYTGQYLALKEITTLGHGQGCNVGFDLAHGAGNIFPDLHDSGADFAAWCNYKYLNSGPGSIASAFVHERHCYKKDLNRFSGWWNHNKKTRFNMRVPFDVLPGAEGWQLSCPPILSMAPIRASLSIFKEIGMKALRTKSVKLTGYLEFLIEQLNHPKIKIITPSHPEERGCQLSIRVEDADKNLYKRLKEMNVIVDWREPNVIRIAPVPLYNSFEDAYRFGDILKNAV